MIHFLSAFEFGSHEIMIHFKNKVIIRYVPDR